jgi:hypothetical protein
MFAKLILPGGFFHPAKTIFAGMVFSMEKTGFFHELAKTCQPCYKALPPQYSRAVDIEYLGTGGRYLKNLLSIICSGSCSVNCLT